MLGASQHVGLRSLFLGVHQRHCSRAWAYKDAKTRQKQRDQLAGAMGRNDQGRESEEHGRQWRVHAALLVAQLLSGGYYVITKVALFGGMNRIVLSLYRDVIALLLLIPAALVIERNKSLKLSREVVLRLFFLGLIGIFGSQFLLFLGIELTTAEFASGMQPSVPVFTAVIAILFGVEAVHWGRREGQAKLAGITLCCMGAIVMTFYKGPPVFGSFEHPKIGALSASHLAVSTQSNVSGFGFTRWQIGAVCLIANCLCMATFINLQAPLVKRFQAPISVIAYSYAFGTIMMGIASYFLVEDSTAWVLHWDIGLLAVLYNGIISSALNFALMSWALSKVGPLFVASYIPVQPVSAAILALFFLKSTVYLGSVLGTVLILLGLLLVSWAREEAAKLAALSLVVEQNYLPINSNARPEASNS